jgi:hypothetical protein
MKGSRLLLHADRTEGDEVAGPRSGSVRASVNVPFGEVVLERVQDLQKPDRPER